MGSLNIAEPRLPRSEEKRRIEEPSDGLLLKDGYEISVLFDFWGRWSLVWSLHLDFVDPWHLSYFCSDVM